MNFDELGGMKPDPRSFNGCSFDSAVHENGLEPDSIPLNFMCLCGEGDETEAKGLIL